MKNKPTKENVGTIIDSVVDEIGEGIYFKIRLNSGKEITCHSSTKDKWLSIPKGKDPQKELKKTCDLLNGYKTDELGNLVKISNFVKKTITIINKD